MARALFTAVRRARATASARALDRVIFDGCYLSKFLRSSARRFLLEMLCWPDGTSYEVARAGPDH